MGTKSIIRQIMRIEGTDEQDAKNIYEQMREEIAEAVGFGDYELAEDIMMEYGFEMDYIFDFI